MTCEEPWRNGVTVSESQTAIIDMVQGRMTTFCATGIQVPALPRTVKLQAGDSPTNENDRRMHG